MPLRTSWRERDGNYLEAPLLMSVLPKGAAMPGPQISPEWTPKSPLAAAVSAAGFLSLREKVQGNNRKLVDAYNDAKKSLGVTTNDPNVIQQKLGDTQVFKDLRGAHRP
jgi:hypothetical protein